MTKATLSKALSKLGWNLVSFQAETEEWKAGHAPVKYPAVYRAEKRFSTPAGVADLLMLGDDNPERLLREAKETNERMARYEPITLSRGALSAAGGGTEDGLVSA